MQHTCANKTHWSFKQRKKKVFGLGPRVVVNTAAFHARARGSVLGRGGLKETKMFLPHPRVKGGLKPDSFHFPSTCKTQYCGGFRDREVACSVSDRQGTNLCLEDSVTHSHHPQEVLLAQFSLYVHKGGLKPDSFHFISSDK